MKQGWRWYGDADAITLKEIRQAGVTDVVAALYERKPGEVWPVAEIKARQKKVDDLGQVLAYLSKAVGSLKTKGGLNSCHSGVSLTRLRE